MTIDAIIYLKTPSTTVLKGPGVISGLRWDGEPCGGEWNFPTPIKLAYGQDVVIQKTVAAVFVHWLGDTVLQLVDAS